MIYTCQEASLISIKNEFSEAGLLQRIRLKLHLLICGPCLDFDIQIKELTRKMKEISCYYNNHKNFYEMDKDCKNRISSLLDKIV